MSDVDRPKAGPFAVICPEHGQVVLTDLEYDTQLDDADDKRFCPVCGKRAEWDDANYESFQNYGGEG